MSEKTYKHFICVSCPVGCELEVTMEDGVATQVTGYTCKRGIEYGIDEATDPKRVVTSLVNVKGKQMPCSVRTNQAIPKRLIPDCVEALRGIELTPPVKIGDVVLKDVCGTGANVIATKNFD
ncbi:MAG: DUF1667 domain-containing protein [Eggerthellaceae bacterium]|nr:DUF1667 domain-containing protein [Eggerthellaceae bacterium]